MSCQKDAQSEYAMEPTEAHLFGRWKLVKTTTSDGAKILEVNTESENYIISFDTTGKVKSSDFPCEGTYDVYFDKVEDVGNHNLVVQFSNCQPSYNRWYSISGSANAILIDDNTLVINSYWCDEGCARTYRRLR
ncbi:hypothetical protein ACFSQ3_07235 [Sphingobacterium corticis]|uniref:Lipocalin-like domain-containing protein n=1 Tax=Sphingobacterium corticis TaxID=1812823 RepID=A0ABW5NI13_9SPHI